MTERAKPPETRQGHTTTMRVGSATLEITTNKWENGGEVFAKYHYGSADAEGLIERVQKGDKRAITTVCEALNAPQGYLERICTMASLAMQQGCPVESIVKHLIADGTWPRGGPGQARSCIDAIARELRTRNEKE